MSENKGYFKTAYHRLGRRVEQKGRGGGVHSQAKLNFRYHNPNTVEDTADYIAKVFVEANKVKMDSALNINGLFFLMLFNRKNCIIKQMVC